MVKRRVLLLDHDGTLLDSFRGHPWALKAKLFFFRYVTPFYFVGEILERFVKPYWPLHQGARELVGWARTNNIMLGIVTDRSLLGLMQSLKLVGLDPQLFDFVHVRTRPLDCFVDVPGGVTVLLSQAFKGEPYALAPLVVYLASLGIKNEEVLFVGDDDRDVTAAMQNGMPVLKVNRYGPDWKRVYSYFEETQKLP